MGRRIKLLLSQFSHGAASEGRILTDREKAEIERELIDRQILRGAAGSPLSSNNNSGEAA
jgi:hypothetical protein